MNPQTASDTSPSGRYQLDGPVAVVGIGLTGASWAALFAAYGRSVRLYDQDSSVAAAGLERARVFVNFLVEHQLANKELAESGLKRLEINSQIETAVKDTVFVQEAVYDSYEAKMAVFQAIDRSAPKRALISSSTSGLSISKIQTATKNPERCLSGHPYNPPHLIPIVEIAPGEATDVEAISAAESFYKSVGKIPVVLKREVPGYLANRMSAALWREAINLVLSGVASVEDVDNAIRYGPGLRWAVMGPHMLYHLGGGEGGIRYHIEHLTKTKEGMLQDMHDWKSMPSGTVDALETGLPSLDEIGDLTSERDEKLAALLRTLDFA
jgi:3-hydroxypropionate dehydrogenase (NADP+)